VGTSGQKFGIHKSLLCHHSAHFKAALTGTLKEAEESLVILNDDSLEVLERFNGWLYTGILLKEEETDGTVTFGVLLDMCVFSENWSVPRLHNAAIDTIIRGSAVKHEVPSGSDIANAWNNTPATSKLHEFLIEMYLRVADLQAILRPGRFTREDLPFDFVADLALALHKERHTNVEDIDFWKERCRWHIHEATEPRCKSPT